MKKLTKKQLDGLPFYSVKGMHYVQREALEALMDELEAEEKEATKDAPVYVGGTFTDAKGATVKP